MTEQQNGGASAPPAAGGPGNSGSGGVAPNRASRRRFRGENSVKAQSRRDFYAAAFDNWALRHGFKP